jgi:predicted hydrocarbon binding protein
MLPTVVDPEAQRCIVLKVPDDPAYLLALWGTLLNLTFAWSWDNDPAHTAKEVAVVMQRYYDEWRECNDMPGECFCCDETNAKLESILDYLHDIRKLLAQGGAIHGTTIYDFRWSTWNTYHEAPTTIHPDTPDITFTEKTGDDENDVLRREWALCQAISDHVDSLIELVIKFYQVAIAGEAVILSALSTPAGAIVVGILAGFFETLTEGLLNNTLARKEVKCCMYNHLHDGDPTNKEDFRLSVSDCGFLPLSDAAQLAWIIDMCNSDETNYLIFLRMLGQYGEAAAESGSAGVEGCTCLGEGLYIWTFFDALKQAWDTLHDTFMDQHAEIEWATATSNEHATDGFYLAGAGEQNLPDHRFGAFKDLYTEHTVTHVYLSAVGSFGGLGLPYLLTFWNDAHEKVHEIGESWAGAGDWKEKDHYFDPPIEHVRYISYWANNQWTHGLDTVKVWYEAE